MKWGKEKANEGEDVVFVLNDLNYVEHSEVC